MPRRPSEKPGLQSERTQLSWERTSLGFLLIGALVLLRHAELPLPGRGLLAALAFGLAVAVILIGAGRASRPSVAPRVAVPVVGWATVGLSVAGCALILWSP